MESGADRLGSRGAFGLGDQRRPCLAHGRLGSAQAVPICNRLDHAGHRHDQLARLHLGEQPEQHLVVGEAGTVLHGDGASWSRQSVSDGTLSDVWGSDAGNIWVVGADGAILKWNGVAWSLQPSGTTRWLLATWGSDVSNVWAVGQTGTILKWNRVAWTLQASGTTNDLYGVWGTDSNNVWVVGSHRTVLKWDGAAWSAQDNPVLP